MSISKSPISNSAGYSFPRLSPLNLPDEGARRSQRDLSLWRVKRELVSLQAMH
jgi:hypothetical protein